jgi:multiple sugar transport system substrate-binding protein
MMFRSSSKKSEAWKFIEYLSEPEQQVRFYELTGDLPSLEDAWNHPVLAGDPQALAFKKQLEHVVPMPQVPEWEQIATKIAEYAEEAIRRRRTVDGALAALDSDVNRMLEKRRWILNRKEAALRK